MKTNHAGDVSPKGFLENPHIKLLRVLLDQAKKASEYASKKNSRKNNLEAYFLYENIIKLLDSKILPVFPITFKKTRIEAQIKSEIHNAKSQ